MISAADLASMRSAMDQSLPDSCDVVRATIASDGAGGETTGWASVATVACRVSPATGREGLIAAALASVGPWIVTVPAETDAGVTDRIAWRGRTFEISSVLAPSTWEIARRLNCTEVK